MFKKVGMGSGGSSQKKLVSEVPPPHIHESQYVSENLQIDEADPPAIIPTSGYKVELGSIFAMDEIEPKLEYVEQYSPYYRDNFYDVEHVNFVGGEEANPIVISVQGDSKLSELKVIVRTPKSDHAFNMPSCSKGKMIARVTDIMPSLDGIKFKEIKDIAIRKDLLHLEDRLLIRQYKFGVIYCKDGQRSDDEMFSNEHGSPEFEEFLDLLGDRIKLQGWQGFDGELDTKTNTTGTHSVFTKVEGWDVMFHVSTLLPYSPVNPQQIERKRHIGNDIGVIIFQDSESTPFDPKTIASKYNHVYAIVQLEKKKTDKHKARYRIAFVSKQAVKPFGPLIPKNPTFKHGPEMRQFLLTKMVNGERAAYSAPSFGVTRTRRDWLKGILSTYK